MTRQLPDYYRFWALMRYLPVYIAYYENGGWGTVPKMDKLEPGKSSPNDTGDRQRLLATGELQAPAAGRLAGRGDAASSLVLRPGAGDGCRDIPAQPRAQRRRRHRRAHHRGDERPAKPAC